MDMRCPGLWRLKRAVRAVRSHAIPHALILYYHRVADDLPDPEWLCVPPKTFREHMEIVARHYRPVRLGELVTQLREGRVARHSVAITFDDGYLDNMEQAKPILSQVGVPATVFVATGYMAGMRQYWWDELAFYLLECRSLPRHVRLRVNGHECVWDCGDGGDPDPRASRWNVLCQHDPTPRHTAYRALAARLRGLAFEDRENALAALARLCGMERPWRAARRCCTAEEVRALGAGGPVDIGAHGCHHTLLASMNAAGQEAEIRESKTVLEEVLGHPVGLFAYPYGSRDDYTTLTCAIVKRLGFQAACTTMPGWVRGRTDPYALPRFHMPALDGDPFLNYLREWDGQCS